jgi:tripartite-type tricarboxylate transporter receptor subunit TctC
MPAEAAQMISASINRALGDEAFRASLTRAGFAPLKPRGEAETRQFVEADRERWLGVVKKLNFSLD